MGIIEAAKLAFEYKKYDENGEVEETIRAVDGVDLDVKKGDFVAILGHNGSGKSTLAKQINAILTPTDGTLYVDGMDVRDEKNIWDVRKTAGMVFQNPDNQIIGTVVEEDVGFGPENMGIPTEEIWERVEESLKSVGMWEYRKNSPNKLSGGQKQRVAIAGVVAMHPKCIVLDEPTAMLDPNGRKEVIRAVRALNQVEKVTAILITHYMEEVIYADKVIVMDDGKIVMQGTPFEIFAQVDTLKKYRLDVPQVTLLAHELRKAGVDLPECVLSTEELVKALCQCSGKSTLIQHLNGLLRATSGAIYYDGENIYQEGYDMRTLRSKVGLVFQYPEHQLFEVDVFSDVCFGPKNLGLSKEEVEERAKKALIQVGLDESYYKKSPFELSGGQKRRVAIAGILAMHPQVLILDEPTAGLDPKGRDEILDQVALLQKERKITVILVSHSMEDVARYVDRIIVVNDGKILFDDTPKQVFQHYKELESVGLAAPQVTYVVKALKEKGWDIDTTATTVEEAKEAILLAIKKREKIC